jgi:hypothetical protein
MNGVGEMGSEGRTRCCSGIRMVRRRSSGMLVSLITSRAEDILGLVCRAGRGSRRQVPLERSVSPGFPRE